MKLFYSFALIAVLASCTDKNKTDAAKANISKKEKINTTPKVPYFNDYKSDLRPNEKLKLDKIYSDTAEFVEFNDGGDYSYVVIKKDNKTIALTTNEALASDYTRGDIFNVKWKMDSVFIAGDGERLDFTEWFVSAEKVKDGSVTLFRKKHKKPIRYYWSGDEEYSTAYKDYLYTLVEYYLANSKIELVKSNIESPDANLIYSIEDGEKNGRSYTVLGISNEFEHRTSIIQWLYLDNENRKLYEYDLGNDKLIEFD